MQNMNVGKRYRAANSANRREYLFVNSVFKTEFRQVAKYFDMIDDCHLARFIGKAMNLHDIPQTVGRMIVIHELPQLSAVFLINHIVRVHPEDPFAASWFQRDIACG